MRLSFALFQDGAVHTEWLLCDGRKHLIPHFLKVSSGVQLIPVGIATQRKFSPNP
jgi:hypothetical protein